MPSLFIFPYSVEGGTPSIFAAPLGPFIRYLVASSASRIWRPIPTEDSVSTANNALHENDLSPGRREIPIPEKMYIFCVEKKVRGWHLTMSLGRYIF